MFFSRSPISISRDRQEAKVLFPPPKFAKLPVDFLLVTALVKGNLSI
jgi:hypothetical protein